MFPGLPEMMSRRSVSLGFSWSHQFPGTGRSVSRRCKHMDLGTGGL